MASYPHASNGIYKSDRVSHASNKINKYGVSPKLLNPDQSPHLKLHAPLGRGIWNYGPNHYRATRGV